MEIASSLLRLAQEILLTAGRNKAQRVLDLTKRRNLLLSKAKDKDSAN